MATGRTLTDRLQVRSRFGAITLLYQARPRFRVLRILLPGSSRDSAVGHSSLGIDHSAASRLAADLSGFLSGSPVRFSTRALALDRCSLFQRRVLLAEFRVPRGRVTTYARLAARIGAPGASRAAGQALATNPFPLIIPCHRAIRSDGSLGGFQGGLRMKRALLELEGIRFTPSGKVDPARPFY